MLKIYEVISCDRTMVVPRTVACCPICQADLYLSFDAWDLEEGGTWTASESGVHLDCSAEPDLDDEEAEDWHAGHYQMPFHDWLPVQHRVWQWVQRRYRFDVPGSEVRRLEQATRLGIGYRGGGR
jgi:hypothetical protein